MSVRARTASRCDYVLHDLESTGRGSWWKADVDLKRTRGYWAIGWDLYETEARYGEARDACSIRIINQDDAGAAELRNLGSREDGIEVPWDLPALDYRVYTVGGFASSLLCRSVSNGIASDAVLQGHGHGVRLRPGDTAADRLSPGR